MLSELPLGGTAFSITHNSTGTNYNVSGTQTISTQSTQGILTKCLRSYEPLPNDVMKRGMKPPGAQRSLPTLALPEFIVALLLYLTTSLVYPQSASAVSPPTISPRGGLYFPGPSVGISASGEQFTTR